MREVEETFNVSLSFVNRTAALHRKHGQVTDPYAQPRRGMRILTIVDEDYTALS